MSDRRRVQRDYPVARGVAPPPGWFRAHPHAEFPVASPVVVPPGPVSRRRAIGWLGQSAVVLLLAGTSMAAGWWLFQGRDVKPTLANAAIAPAQPAPMPAVVATTPEPEPVAAPPAAPSPPPEPARPPSTSPPAKPAPTTTTSVTFQKDILPIFQAKCITCHGANDKAKGGLDLRSAAALARGGESGPLFVRGEPEKSLLWETVANDQMPPNKNKLSASEKAKLKQWIANGP